MYIFIWHRYQISIVMRCRLQMREMKKWETSCRARYCLGRVAAKEQSRAVAIVETVAIVSKVETVAILAGEKQSWVEARGGRQQTNSSKISIAQLKLTEGKAPVKFSSVLSGNPNSDSWSHCASRKLITPICIRCQNKMYADDILNVYCQTNLRGNLIMYNISEIETWIFLHNKFRNFDRQQPCSTT